MSDQQRQKIISLLETAHKLSIDLQDSNLAYLIERAIDEGRAGAYPLKSQAPYFAGPPQARHLSIPFWKKRKQ